MKRASWLPKGEQLPLWQRVELLEGLVDVLVQHIFQKINDTVEEIPWTKQEYNLNGNTYWMRLPDGGRRYRLKEK